MSKADLVKAIAETNASQKDAADFFDALIDALTEQLKAGNDNFRIQLPGLGSLQKKRRNSKKGRNPRTGAEITIPAKNVVKFSTAKKLDEAVN